MSDDYLDLDDGGGAIPAESIDVRSLPAVMGTVGGLTGRTSGTSLAAMLPAVPPARDYDRLLDRAKRAGSRIGSQFDAQGNNRAIYSFPAGGSRIEGATVWLIGALWQDYGHLLVDSEVTSEDETTGKVTITSTVVDRVNGTIYRRDHKFTLAPAPAKFAAKVDQASRWAAMQMQSAISKAERTTVEHFLPAWYVDAAKAAAYESARSQLLTKKDGTRGTLVDALDAVEGGFKALGVARDALVDHIGVERAHWSLTELGTLRALYGEIKRGSVTVEATFGPTAPPTTTPRKEGLAAIAAPPVVVDAGHVADAQTAPAQTVRKAKAAAPAPAPVQSDGADKARSRLIAAGVTGQQLDRRMSDAAAMVGQGIARDLDDAAEMLTSDMGEMP